MPRCNNGSWCAEDYCNHAEPGERWCDGEQRYQRPAEDAQVDGPFSVDRRPPEEDLECE